VIRFTDIQKQRGRQGVEAPRRPKAKEFCCDTYRRDRRRRRRSQVSPARRPVPVDGGEEFDALVADIKANGLCEPIVLYEDKILDGRNRYRACLAAKVEPHFMHPLVRPKNKNKELAIIDDPVAYVISKNIHRRHLTAKERRVLIAKLIAAQPEKSDRQIAKQAKVGRMTVGRVRATVPGGTVEKRVGKDGKARKQPAKKKVAVTPEQEEADRAEVRRLAKNVDAFVEAARHRGIVDAALLLVHAMTSEESKEFFLRLKKLYGGYTTAGVWDNGKAPAGNDADPETSAEAMKAKHAAADDGLDLPKSLRREAS
jgi:ParB-like chromosome segregation protein Spo0J